MKEETRQKFIKAIEAKKLSYAVKVMQGVIDIANLSKDPLHKAAEILSIIDNDIDEGSELFDVCYNHKYFFTIVLDSKINKVHLSSGIEVNILNENNECVDYFAYDINSGYISDMDDEDAECFYYDTISDLYNEICLGWYGK